MNALGLVAGALEELEQARGLLEDLRRHVATGAPAEGAALIASSAESRLGVAGLRIREAARAAGTPHRWKPGDPAPG